MENRYNQALLITLSSLEELDRRYTGKIFSLAQPCGEVLHIRMRGTANLLHPRRQMQGSDSQSRYLFSAERR